MAEAGKSAGEEVDDQEAACLERALAGDQQALASLFDNASPRLLAMVRLRMDRRLQGRIDPADVVQEAYVDVVTQLPSDVKKSDRMSFFLWLRLVTSQRLMRLQRLHVGAEMRDVGREISLHRGDFPMATSVSLAAQLMGRFTSVSQKAIRMEMRIKLQEVLNGMEAIDREIIALRHFEELTNQEAAESLGLSKAAASNRYVRALARLQQALESFPGFLDQST